MDPTELAHRISSAVTLALSPPSASNPAEQQREAYNFLEQVKLNSNESWQACLALFLAGAQDAQGVWMPQYAQEGRMFSLQVVDDILERRFDSLGQDEVQLLYQGLTSYITQGYVFGKAEGSAIYLRNKFVHTLNLLLQSTYLLRSSATLPSPPPSLFGLFLPLLYTHSLPSSTNPSTSAPQTQTTSVFNPLTVDLFLRFLHETSTDLSDKAIALGKSGDRLARDNRMRDAFRERDAESCVSAVWEVIRKALEVVEGKGKGAERNGLEGREEELLQMALTVVGDHVGWVDINLIISPNTLPLLYTTLSLPSLPIRLASSDALLETLLKGMPSSSFLSLLTFLSLHSLLPTLLAPSLPPELLERFAKVTAAAGSELVKIISDGPGLNNAQETIVAAEGMLGAWIGLSLEFLASPVPSGGAGMALASPYDIQNAVIPFLGALLTMWKKQRRKSGGEVAGQVEQEKRDVLRRMLEAVVGKMAFGGATVEMGPSDTKTNGVNGHEHREREGAEEPEPADWMRVLGVEILESDEEDDTGSDDGAGFAEFRKNLKTLFDGVAGLDEELFATSTHAFVIGTLDSWDASKAGRGPAVSWQKAELAMHLLYCFGASFKGTAPNSLQSSLLLIPKEDQRRIRSGASSNNLAVVASGGGDSSSDLSRYPLSPLGQMILRAVKSQIVSFPHPAVQLVFFECAVRYHELFKLCPETIADVLPFFLDERGLHQPIRPVRRRCWYLFNRFIVQARDPIQANVSGQLISEILGRMQDLLVVDAAVPALESPDEDPLGRAVRNPGTFNSQLVLFETVGTLVSILNQVPDQQVELLKTAITPLVQNMRSSVLTTPVRTSSDLLSVLRVHHHVLALSHIMKGFPDLSTRQSAPSRQWVSVLKEVTKATIEILASMNSFQVIREAVRFQFTCVVATTGEAVLDLVPPLLQHLVGQVKPAELADFCALIGQLVYRFKTQFSAILDELVFIVIQRVWYFLSQPVNGTDDALEHASLCRAYFGLITNIIREGQAKVFRSERNKVHLQELLNSVVHYLTNDTSIGATEQKAGFVVLGRLAQIWCAQLGPTPKVQGWAPMEEPIDGFERFLYENAVKPCFDVPMRAGFDWGDSTSYQVIGDAANFLKTMLQKRGDEAAAYLTEIFLPSIGCPPDQGATFVQAMRAAVDGKACRKPMVDFLTVARGR